MNLWCLHCMASLGSPLAAPRRGDLMASGFLRDTSQGDSCTWVNRARVAGTKLFLTVES